MFKEADSEEVQVGQLSRLKAVPEAASKADAAKGPPKHLMTKKNRTISTLSDFTYSSLDQNAPNGSIYYRLASCGQDNQIAFWDLTEDVLKEKASGQSRSRLTSLNASSNPVRQQAHADLPQIIIQPSELLSLSSAEASKKASPASSGSHSSIVSTARNLFSLKHSDLAKGKATANGEVATTAASSSSFFSKKVSANGEIKTSLVVLA